jgi:hypothetical protein
MPEPEWARHPDFDAALLLQFEQRHPFDATPRTLRMALTLFSFVS